MVKTIIEKSYLVYLLIYLLAIFILVFLNPYKILYQTKDVSQLYFTKDNVRVRTCGMVEEIEQLTKYKKIKICSFYQCYSGHIDNKNEISKKIEKYLKNQFCFFGKIKKVYKNFYIEIESIDEKEEESLEVLND